jgi:hypothetical protein
MESGLLSFSLRYELALGIDLPLDLGSLSHMYLAQVVLFIQTLLIEVMGET